MDEPAGGSSRDGDYHASFNDICWDDDEFITGTENFIKFTGEDPKTCLQNWNPSYLREFFDYPLPSDQPAGAGGPVVEQQTSTARTTSAASQINVQQQSHVAVSVSVHEESRSSSRTTGKNKSSSVKSIIRRCSHCGASQWRMGALGPNTHCNACGLRYKSARLDPPITSDQPSGAGGPVYIDNVEQQTSTTTSAATSQVKFQHEETQQSPVSVLEKGKNKSCDTDEKTIIRKCCTHCGETRTSQWRMGPSGPKTLCNACGLRFKSGRLCPEYRPAASPTFDSSKHSNFHQRIMKDTKRKRRNFLVQEHDGGGEGHERGGVPDDHGARGGGVDEHDPLSERGHDDGGGVRMHQWTMTLLLLSEDRLPSSELEME
ncbi:hypothetical protein RD792_013225 [Penstemon davidsonii]|uniref:GATA-type domain-containing protein n=1 Tax=Penstemon davidsonii TaxID=160366 RepID=A0ABR0CUD6_9LAMI|nr:hypothetical protein RD792_013225 [Penstemon davidsonii]